MESDTKKNSTMGAGNLDKQANFIEFLLESDSIIPSLQVAIHLL